MPDDAKPAPTFEQSLDELEAVVKQLDSGDLPLEQSLALFERGVALTDICRKQLEEAETRVEILMKRGDKIAPAPFQPGK